MDSALLGGVGCRCGKLILFIFNAFHEMSMILTLIIFITAVAQRILVLYICSLFTVLLFFLCKAFFLDSIGGRGLGGLGMPCEGVPSRRRVSPRWRSLLNWRSGGLGSGIAYRYYLLHKLHRVVQLT